MPPSYVLGMAGATPLLLAPTIATARLTLRAHRRDDFAACAAMWADPIVTRFIGGKPSTAPQTWARMMGYLGHWQLMGFGYWAVEENRSGNYIGELGFADFKRAIEPPLEAPELGWALASHAHRQGYATEAVRAVLAWGDANLPAARTACIIDPDNVPSLRIAAAAGYREFARSTVNERPAILFERARP